MVWNNQACAFKCKPWTQISRRVSRCFEFQPYQNFLPETVDTMVCGSTFLDKLNGESCEFHDYSFSKQLYDANKECDGKCKIIQNSRLVCREDVFGKSECRKCTLEYCNTYKDIDTIKRDCQQNCLFRLNSSDVFVNSTDKFESSRRDPGGTAYYFDRIKLIYPVCSSTDLNIVAKITDETRAWENCKLCEETTYYRSDPILRYCFDSEERIAAASSGIITSITADNIYLFGYIVGGVALFMFFISPLFLYKLNAMSVFFRFWETMQLFYMLSYYIDNTYKTQVFFRQFKFVTFELFNYKGFIMINLIKWLLPSTGMKVIYEAFRNMSTRAQFNSYLQIMAKYFEKQRIGLFIYDCSALLDLFILLGFLVLMANLALALYLRIKSRTGLENKALNIWMEKLGKVNDDLFRMFLSWFFMENYVIFMFFALSQYYTLPSIANNYGNALILVNKILLFCISTFGLTMLPAYHVGVAVDFFQDEQVLNRIRGIGFNNTGSGVRIIYPLTVIRKILMALYFCPAVNTGGNTLYCFVVVILSIVEFTMLAFRKVYQHDAVTNLQIFGTFILGFLAFTLMFDKLFSSILAVSNQGTANHKILMNYFTVRELTLMSLAIFTVFFFFVGTLYIIVVVRKQVLEAEAIMLKNKVGHSDETNEIPEFSKYIEDDILDRKNIELAAL